MNYDMRLLFRLSIVFSMVFLFSFEGLAQDIGNEEEQRLPTYNIENLTETKIDESTVLPFVSNGYLYAFSLENRALIWRIFIGGDLENPFLVYDNYLYFYDIYNRVYAIDMFKKKILWRLTIDNEIKTNLLIYDKYIIVLSLKGNITLINKDNGETFFKYEATEEIGARLTIYKDLIIVPYKSGRVIAYDIHSKNEKWIFNSNGIISVTPVVKGKCLYFGAWDDTFYALDVESGRPKWISYVGENITRRFLVFDNEIILFLSNGEMLSLSTKNGNIKWVNYLKNVEFNYNYFQGYVKTYIFTPDFIAINPDKGNIIFNYRERVFKFYKQMLFNNMIEGKNPLSEEIKNKMLADVYFNVDECPVYPPVRKGDSLIYFVTESSCLYVYDLDRDFFIVKYKMG